MISLLLRIVPRKCLGHVIAGHPRRPFATAASSPGSIRLARSTESRLDHLILAHIKATTSTARDSYCDYLANSHRILPDVLPYRPYPLVDARGDGVANAAGIVNVIHATVDPIDYVVSSGFLVQAAPKPLLATCTHTLLQLHHRHPDQTINSFILSSHHPITSIAASLPSSDIMLCELHTSIRLPALPVSPFPIYWNQDVLVHMALSDGGEGTWARGKMMGYRDLGWQEVEAGTASALPYIITSPLPTPGSSGGPILDAETGAVVGMVCGKRMENTLQGERGWGASAENIFEMFSLPGFTPASQKG